MSQNKSRKALSTQTRTTKSTSQQKGSSNGHTSPVLNSKTGLVPSKRAGIVAPPRREKREESDMPGLPEFCTTCEKQIMTPPGTSVLYCSEACRKEDTSFRPLSIRATLSPSSTIPSTTSYFDLPESDIVEPRSPTILRPASTIFSEFDVADFAPSADEEPKDAEVTSDSAAARYLAQFYSQNYAVERSRPRRPRANRNSSAADGIPSLSHTPSSSVGTAGSFDRPLPRRYGSMTGQSSSRSFDLVAPDYPISSASDVHRPMENSSLESGTSTITAVKVGEEANSFERATVSSDHRQGTSSGLKQLFSYDSNRTH